MAKDSIDTYKAFGDCLKRTQIANRSGSFLYSGIDTLSRGDIYFLGLNPGGDPDCITKTVFQHFKERCEDSSHADFNEYCDGRWKTNKQYDPGEKPLQKRFRWLFEELGYDPRKICASNLIFARSKRSADLKDKLELARSTLPIHEKILELMFLK